MNQKMRLFAEAWTGDIVEAMKIAGYSGADSYLKNKGAEFLRREDIQNVVENRNKYVKKANEVVATRLERQAFWSSIMRNKDPHAVKKFDVNGNEKPKEDLPLSTRLKASEMLGKSEADFVEKLSIDHNVTISEVISESMKLKDVPVEAIEAQYKKLKEGDKSDDKTEVESIDDLL